MASLKEIKGRISGTTSTQKVTSAMKMVASAKLNKAQLQVNRFMPYENKAAEILQALLASDVEIDNDLLKERPVKRVAIVVISSNSGLCGAFNVNMQKMLADRLKFYRDLGEDNIELYPLGKKITECIFKNYAGDFVHTEYNQLTDKPDFSGAKELGDRLMKDFTDKKIDKVEILYNHPKSSAVQLPTMQQLLPVIFEKKETAQALKADYIIEPDKKSVFDFLIPKSLYNKIYLTFLGSMVAEYAARTVAMQIATDNATDLLDELNVLYNKQRQQKITNELLDIVSGSEALK